MIAGRRSRPSSPQTTYVPVYNQTSVQYNPLQVQRNQLPAPGFQQPLQNGQNLVQNMRKKEIHPTAAVIQSSSVGYAPSTIYVKVPSGTLTVSFKENIVDSLDLSEGTTASGQVSVVIPPVNVYW